MKVMKYLNPPMVVGVIDPHMLAWINSKASNFQLFLPFFGLARSFSFIQSIQVS